MKKITQVLLDAGHGGMIDGKYVTPGKRSPIDENGDQLYEGVNNREIREEVAKLLKPLNVTVKYVNEGNKDMSLSNRCATANALAGKRYKETLFISIHSDAHQYKYIDKDCTIIYSRKKHGIIENSKLYSKPYLEFTAAHGASCYTSPGPTASDVVAEAWYEEARVMWPDAKLRTSKSDGDLDKEARFTVLTKTKCPAILIENFFMTNKEEYLFLKSKQGKREIAQVIVNTIKRFL